MPVVCCAEGTRLKAASALTAFILALVAAVVIGACVGEESESPPQAATATEQPVDANTAPSATSTVVVPTPTAEPAASTPTPTAVSLSPNPTATPQSSGVSDNQGTPSVVGNELALPEAYTSIPWIADGVDSLERWYVEILQDVEAKYGDDSSTALLHRPWLRDGLDGQEPVLLILLKNMGANSVSHVRPLLALPFMETIEPSDVDAIQLLASLGNMEGREEFFQAVLKKHWVKDGLTSAEIRVLTTLGEIPVSQPDPATIMLGLPFLQSVDPADADTVDALSRLATNPPALYRQPWIRDGIGEHEVPLVQTLETLKERSEDASWWIATLTSVVGSVPYAEGSLGHRYDVNGSGDIEQPEALAAAADAHAGALDGNDALRVVALFGHVEGIVVAPALLDLVEATRWYRESQGAPRADDGPKAHHALRRISEGSPDVAKEMARWLWIFDDDLTSGEAALLADFNRLLEYAPNIALKLLEYPWLADGIEEMERRAVVELYSAAAPLLGIGRIWAGSPQTVEFAMELASAPWMRDGVTAVEVSDGLHALGKIHGYYPAAGRILLPGTLNATSDFDFLINRVINGMGGLVSRLEKEPWFADGLDKEERLLIVTASLFPGVDRVLTLSFTSHHIVSKRITLPLAGDVELWAVSEMELRDPNATLKEMEDAVRNTEEFWGLPLPVNDVIFVVIQDRPFGGLNYGYAIVIGVNDEGVPARGTAHHEVGHYYATPGPRWFVEGASEAVRYFTMQGEEFFTKEFPERCAPWGFDTIKGLDSYTRDDAPDHLGHWNDCLYSVGPYLMLALNEAMGHDAWLSAMREYYLDARLYSLQGQPTGHISNEVIYGLFIKHTPSERLEEVIELITRVHGGRFVPAPYTSPRTQAVIK